MFVAQAVVGERGNVEVAGKGGDGVDGVGGGRGGPPGEAAGDLFEAGVGRRGLRGVGGFADVHAEDGRQERCADGAVRGVEHGAEWGGEAVYGAEAGVGEGKAAEKAGQGHVAAGGRVGAMAEGRAEGPRDEVKSIPAEGVGERVGAVGDEGFDQLGEGVEAGRGGQGRGHGVGEVGVDQGEAGKHPGMAEADLDFVLGGGEDRIAGDLGAGAGGGGDGDDGEGLGLQGLAFADDFEVIEDGPAVGGEGGDGLGGVDDAAAADGDDGVAGFVTHLGGAFAGQFEGRLVGDMEGGDGNAAGGEKAADGFGGLGTVADDDEGAGAVAAGEVREVIQAARAEKDAVGGGELEGHEITRPRPGDQWPSISR